MANKKIEFILDVNSKPIDVAIDATLNLKQQYRELVKEINKTKEGTKEFELLSSKLGDVKDRMETTTAKSRDLFGSLSLLPGPVGMFSSSVDNAIGSLKLFTSFSFKDIKFQLAETANDFKDIVSNIGKATGITKIYTVLNNALSKSFIAVGVGEQAAAAGARTFAAALTATGVGALVVALGFLVSKLMEYGNQAEKTAEEQKKLNEEMAKGAQAGTDAVLKFLNQSEKLEIQRAKNAGKTEEQIQAIRADYAKRREAQLKKNLEDLQKIQGADTAKAADALYDEQQNNLQQKEEYNGQVIEKQKAANQKLAEKNKQHREKIAADNKTADEILLNLQRENAALSIQDERKRQDIELQNQKKAEEDKVNALLISEKRKAEIVGQIKIKYAAKQTDVDNKRKEEDLKAEQDFNDKVAEIRIAAERNEFERSKQERERKYIKDLSDLEKDKEFIKKSETEKAQIRKNLKTAFDNDINKMNLEDKLRKAAIEKGDDDSRYMRLVNGAQFDLDLQRKLLEDKKKSNDKYYAEQLAAEGLTTDQIRELNAAKLADQIAYTEKSNQIERDRIAVKQKALDDIISIAGAETGVGRAALIAKQILLAKELFMDAKKTITFSAQAAARSTVAVAEGTAQTAKVGFPQNIPLLIGYAAQAFGILSAIKSATSSANASAGGNTDLGGTPGQTNLGRNYEDGGMINGPRHAQGGVMINAEGGEAVMTRGAVTMFAPLLSAMNQMGGGTSFGNQLNVRPDAAIVERPAQDQSPVIMKTYVVSNELTTEQEKLARLKDLSTL